MTMLSTGCMQSLHLPLPQIIFHKITAEERVYMTTGIIKNHLTFRWNSDYPH